MGAGTDRTLSRTNRPGTLWITFNATDIRDLIWLTN